MAAEIAEAKKKTAYAELGTALVKYVLGPLIVALGIGGYTMSGQKQSAVGYEVLAKSLNQEVMVKLESLEKRIIVLEKLAPASQPVVAAPATQPKPGHTPDGKPVPAVVTKAPTKAPVVTKTGKEGPHFVGLKVEPKPAPAAKAAPTQPEQKPAPLKRVPIKLNDAKL